uniref:Uncharacterized protein n=1 Tax=Anopheles epiroticus TaxID=199890 RepID=A0A182PR11_9DIPT
MADDSSGKSTVADGGTGAGSSSNNGGGGGGGGEGGNGGGGSPSSADGSSASARKPLSVARLKEKGKKMAAAHIHRELAVNGKSESLIRLMDDLLLPESPISLSENIEWCRWLIAGGRTPAEFASIGKLACGSK